MKRILIVAAVFLCLAGTGIAADFVSLNGTYVSKKDAKEYLSLYTDGTFMLRQRKMPPSPEIPFVELSGKYEIRGEGKIALLLPDGGEATGTVTDNTFEDAQGTKWVKAGSEQREMKPIPHNPQHKPHSY